MKAKAHIWDSEDNRQKSVPSFHLGGSWGSNSGSGVWWCVSFHSEPSHGPYIVLNISIHEARVASKQGALQPMPLENGFQ